MKDRERKMGFLSVDSVVEVNRDKEGFRGAWFVAKILKEKRKGKVLVQYQSLVREKGRSLNQPLTEVVDISFIRPLPPPPASDQSYEPLDVVEAFHRDGWWKGTVSKVEVLENKSKSRRYKVVLENFPQQFDFSSEYLRFHLVCIDGSWVQPPNQKRMGGLNIVKGMAVEVNFDRDKLPDAWFPAIVLEKVGVNSFLVEYSRSGNDCRDVNMKETAGQFHIRPLPPKLEIQYFEILERVEAFHDSCWKKGMVTTIFTRGRQVRQCALFQEMPDRAQCEEESAEIDKLTKHSEVVVSVKCSSTAQDHTEEESSPKRTSNAKDDAEEKLYIKKSRKNLVDIQKESDALGRLDKGEQQNVSEGTGSEMDFRDGVTNEAELSTATAIENGGEQKNVSEGMATEMDFKDCASKEAESSGVTDMENEDQTAKVEASCDAVIEAANDDLAQSTCFRSDREGNVEIVNQFAAINVQADSELVKMQEMPFSKSSQLWDYVDSLEVFKFLPQKPHFTPLFECWEATREGYAISHMLNFATLVEKTSKLQAKEPRKVFDSYLVALADLEMVGFDVKAVVDRVIKLLSIKTRKEQLENLFEGIRSEIAECDGEKAKMEEEINAIEKMISDLEEQRAMKALEKAMRDSESNLLQMDVNRINEEISNGKLDFESQATAHW